MNKERRYFEKSRNVKYIEISEDRYTILMNSKLYIEVSYDEGSSITTIIGKPIYDHKKYRSVREFIAFGGLDYKNAVLELMELTPSWC